MAKQMIDAALRQQIAQWIRAALGQLVEDDGTMGKAAPIVERSTCCITGSEPEVAGPGVMRYSRGRGAGQWEIAVAVAWLACIGVQHGHDHCLISTCWLCFVNPSLYF